MKTVFVLVDALKSLYLTEDNMPFLYGLSKKGQYIKQVIPCAGFCERSEIFSGLDGFDTGNFTAIGYLPENSPYRNDYLTLRLFEIIRTFNERLYQRLFQSWRIHSKKRLNNYRIPPASLRNFALTEDGIKRIIPHRDIFNVLTENGMTYTLDGFTSLADLGRRTELSVSALAQREIEKGTDFIPLYIGETDSIGHHYGDDIESIRPTLKKVDQQLKSIYEKASASNYSFCVLGDHGMVPVKNKIDVISLIQGTGLRLHKDYEAFYDSTMARFWFISSEAKQIITSILKQLCHLGILVDEENFFDYRLPLDIKGESGRPIYGDIVWCANPGVLISPDYFHTSSDNGMHGYIKTIDGHGTGLFVEMFPGIAPIVLDNAHSSQICEELCKSLGIESPNNIKWIRIV